MPIYEYRCSACGLEKEFLQKVNEPLKTTCPACGQEKLVKQLSAAGFQLKGSGWYATDFKGGSRRKEPSKDQSTEQPKEQPKEKPATCSDCACAAASDK